MRTEAEIREAIAILEDNSNSDLQNAQDLILARDSSIEALRFCLGIDDADSSPMHSTLAELLQSLKENPQQGLSA